MGNLATRGNRTALVAVALALTATLTPIACAQIIGADKDRVPADAAAQPASTSVTTNTVAPCDTTQKTCDGVCVAIDDPLFGCSPTSCAPCAIAWAAKSKCVAGACAIATCKPAHADCDGDPSNGCEGDLTEGPTCGSCTTACPGSAKYCTPGGTCTADCSASGLLPCDISSSCVALDSSPTNCGACGNVCPPHPNGDPACVSSTCTIACSDGFNNCDGDLSNGCESQPKNYVDGDNDTFGVNTASPIYDCTPPPGYASQPGDCLDTNANVNPNQTNFFSTSYITPKGDPSFDYNCDNVEEGTPGGKLGGSCVTCTTGIEPVPGAKNANVYCGSNQYANCVIDTGQTCSDQAIPRYACR